MGVDHKLKAMHCMGVLQLVINDNVLIDEKDVVRIEAMQSDNTFEVEPLGAEKIKGKYAASSYYTMH